MAALKKIDPNAKTTDPFYGATIFHWCAGYAWKGGVEYLMSCNPNIYAEDRYGDLAFHWIGKWSKDPKHDVEVLEYFVQKGQDVNAIGNCGQSILIRFVACKHTDAVQYLLKKTEIDVYTKLTKYLPVEPAKGYEAERAIDIARRENENEIVEMIEKKTPVKCVTNNEFGDRTRDVDTLYYLRFLSDNEFKILREKAFSTLHNETGHYIGCTRSENACKHLSIGERSEFKIVYNSKERSFRVLSSKKDQLGKTIQERILSWSQSVGNGLFMYKIGNQDWDYSNKHTRFTYNAAEHSFSANPSDGLSYQLGVYKQSAFMGKYTAIYRVDNGGEKRTRFCFQKVNQAEYYNMN